MRKIFKMISKILSGNIEQSKKSVIDASLPKLKDYEKYDIVIREMIDKEISRQDSHLKWTNAVQIALVPLLFNVADKESFILIPFTTKLISNISVICILGIICSFIYFTTYLTSEMRMHRIFYFWDGYCKHTNTTYFDYPPIWGNPITDNKLKEGCKAHEHFGKFSVNLFRRLTAKAISKKVYPFVTGALWAFLMYFH